jgi:hypothetical protein
MSSKHSGKVSGGKTTREAAQDALRRRPDSATDGETRGETAADLVAAFGAPPSMLYALDIAVKSEIVIEEDAVVPASPDSGAAR